VALRKPAPDGGRTGDVRDRLVLDENTQSQDDLELCFRWMERRLIGFDVPLPDDGIGGIESEFHLLFRLFEFMLPTALLGHVSSDQQMLVRHDISCPLITCSISGRMAVSSVIDSKSQYSEYIFFPYISSFAGN